MKYPKKVFIRLDGRLGNQLFQLALALNISQQFNVKVLLDDHLSTHKGFERFLFKELSVFKYFQYCSKLHSFANRIQHNSTLRRFYKADNLFIESETGNYDLDLAKPYKSYTGFFQSPSFFPKRDVILKAFSLRSEFICEALSRLLHLTEETECLAVSIRRGDFLKNSHLGVCSHEYYLNGIDLVRNRISVNCIFVFSDDIGYCRELLTSLDCQVIYVEGFTPAKSLYLMSHCKHFVIANSTFSWWGAWLSEHQDKLVISPKPWNDKDAILSDFIPPDWIALPKHPILITQYAREISSQAY
ncbi:alpha-1,2-fucosyltransferase [Dolichospermum planctonicum CS-1226]|uniref:Alpha-1,2-fucosyltransferase n=1 Tax=Dolichospermum planctonicum CS-1226 TaxID=3021751 RepID=A0ABT5ALR9_9CYAN|nr:alpha-1,2-fucosyltransferase [Dolichospermum planctonicum]MDB9537688.1 alpha-1,2-fucosyltransferase [Dolichospermum planctonicum CS-1226]